MDQYIEVIKECRNFPREIKKYSEKDFKLYPISPKDFDVSAEKVLIKGSAVDAIRYVQTVTEKYRKEYTLVLYGERRNELMRFGDYSIAEGMTMSASFQKEQLRMAKKTYKNRNGEVIYAHTHVARGVNYNCFSVNDLLFLIKQALQNKRDTYALLITKDGVIPVKYSIMKNEFFRIHIKVA